MRQQAVLQHYRSVLSQERRYTRANHDKLLAATQGIPETWRIIDSLSDPRKPSIDFVSDLEQPRISHNLFSCMIEELGSSQRTELARGLKFIGGVLLPLSGVRIRPPTASALLSGVNEDSCSNAERYFRNSLTQVRTGRFLKQRQLHVFYDTQQRPLALQKILDVPTSLLLQDTTLAGPVKNKGVTHIPAGTIVNIGDNQRSNQVARKSRSGAITYSASMVSGSIVLQPLRFSPWVHDDQIDRALFAVERRGPHDTPTVKGLDRLSMVTDTRLEDFQSAATWIMQYCGVEAADMPQL